MILLLSLSLLNRRQMKQTRFKRMVSFKPSPQQLQLCSRNDHDHQTPSTSLSLSARYFNFLLKPNHCFHHCISSYPATPPPPPNFFISSLKGRWRSQRSSQFTQPKTFQPIGFMYIKHSPVSDKGCSFRSRPRIISRRKKENKSKLGVGCRKQNLDLK
ncbi:hypothetical protein GLYMA_04G231351v4 [Glycine max]|nr:hypothetical protein GLYMA_04G231351v4 [Glycine max]